ncbi:MAG: anti-sigma factor antagonist [Clostridiales bacterium]|nr:anti-sigma factor antagonist [Clostridiales bacterium]
MQIMKIAHKTENRTLYVWLSGELDESCAAAARARLDSLFDSDNLSKVVLDFSGVTFMDSTGIGMLLGRYKKLKARAVPLLIRSPQTVVDKLLLLSGIYEIMPKINA